MPTMHMAKILHSILLYKVRGVSICLSPKFLRKLDSFMVSPCAYGDGWIHYSDVLDMLPMKVQTSTQISDILNVDFFCLKKSVIDAALWCRYG